MVSKTTKEPVTLRGIATQVLTRTLEQSFVVVLLIALLVGIVWAFKSETVVTGARFQQSREDLQEARKDAAFWRGLALNCRKVDEQPR